MSDDIVTRLREEWAKCLTCTAGNEAADEIERLRAELKEAQNGLTYIVRIPNV